MHINPLCEQQEKSTPQSIDLVLSFMERGYFDHQSQIDASELAG